MKNNLKRTESLTAQSKQISKKNKFLMLYNKQMKRQKHTQLAMLLVITQNPKNPTIVILFLWKKNAMSKVHKIFKLPNDFNHAVYFSPEKIASRGIE